MICLRKILPEIFVWKLPKFSLGLIGNGKRILKFHFKVQSSKKLKSYQKDREEKTN